MSSPQQQPVSLSQFTMLSSSPLKPSTFYFQEQDTTTTHTTTNSGSLLSPGDRLKPSVLSYANESQEDSVYLDSHKDEDFVVPVSQQNDCTQNESIFSNNISYLKYPQHTYSTGQKGVSMVDISQLQNFQQQQQQHFHPHLHHNYHSRQSQSQEQQQEAMDHPQMNLFPAMEFMPTHNHQANSHGKSPSRSGIKESASSNTIASHDSIPLLAMSSSVSDTSIASPMSFQNHTTATPRRAPNSRRFSNLTTTPSQILQTPSRNNGLMFTSPTTFKTVATPSSSIQKNRPMHRRTRSRLSLDSSGAAAIVTTLNTSISSTSVRSPSATGTNPFYTAPAFLSPHNQSHDSSFNGSPDQTPLNTPSALRKFHSSNSISPNMLMTSASAGLSDDQDDSKANSSVYSAATNLALKLAAKYTDPSHQQLCFNQPLSHYHPQHPDLQHRFPTSQQEAQSGVIPEHSNDYYSLPHDLPMMDQIPESATEISQFSASSASSTSVSSPSMATISSTTSLKSSRAPALARPISRSHSSINLSSIIAPPEIQHYDILQPRKKKSNKSNSTTTTIMQTNEALIKQGKPPKKVHVCPLCDAAFQRPEHVKRHMRSHSSEKPFECDELGCGKRFNRPDNLKAHLRKIHKRPV